MRFYLFSSSDAPSVRFSIRASILRIDYLAMLLRLGLDAGFEGMQFVWILKASHKIVSFQADHGVCASRMGLSAERLLL